VYRDCTSLNGYAYAYGAVNIDKNILLRGKTESKRSARCLCAIMHRIGGLFIDARSVDCYQVHTRGQQ
jgi:hypothetical protein